MTRPDTTPHLIAIDLDGTLLQPDGGIHPADRAAVAHAVAAGHHVVIATARPPRISRDIAADLGLTTPSVHYNGALVLNGEGDRLDHHTLPAALAYDVAAAARSHRPEVVLDVEADLHPGGSGAGRDAWHTDRLHPTLHTKISATGQPDRRVPDGDLAALFDRDVTKLMLVAEPEAVPALEAVLREQFGAAINIAISDAHLLQVVSPHATKASGCARVAAHLRIAPAHTLAIGDAPNDAEMLRWAATGVAVHNAWPALKSVADVVAPAGEPSVAWAITRLIEHESRCE